MDIDGRRENGGHAPPSGISHAYIQKPLRACSYRRIEKTEHHNDSANNIKDAISFSAKSIEYYSWRVEPYNHRNTDTHIEHQRILGNSFMYVLFQYG